MKKNMLASMALGALLFVGCNSMEDKNKKDEKYYLEHIEEAQSKLKWCLTKLNLDKKELEKVVNDVIKARNINLIDSYYNLSKSGNINLVDSYYNLSKEMQNGGSNGLKEVDASNCVYSLKAYLENELEKAKK